MKKLKLILSLVILVFATTAGFSQQTKKSEVLGKPDRMSRKQAQTSTPEVAKDSQLERSAEEANPTHAEDGAASRNKNKKYLKHKKQVRKKGHISKNKKIKKDRQTEKAEVRKKNHRVQKPLPTTEKATPTKDARYPTKKEKMKRPEKTEGESTTKKRRSRKGK